MAARQQGTFAPRKTPVQARAAVTVDAIAEASIQVLLAGGLDSLTTTRVAARAGVSVGTLYQYYPNKQALLLSVLEQHLRHVAEAVERACAAQHGCPLRSMAEAAVAAFIDAKMERADISVALYAVASDLNGEKIVSRAGNRARQAMARMLATAPGVEFPQVQFTAMLLMAAMSGATRAVLESGATPKAVQMMREQLRLLCLGYLRAAAVRV